MPSFPKADLRSTANDFNRDGAHKHKWALGASDGVGRAIGKPRPRRPSETEHSNMRRWNLDSLEFANRVTRKHSYQHRYDIETLQFHNRLAGKDKNLECDELPSPPPVDVDTTYSFDALRSPTEGDEILNVALVKAVQKFEDRETVKLVKSEYELLDSDGAPMTPSDKKRKHKAKSENPTMPRNADEEEYDFV